MQAKRKDAETDLFIDAFFTNVIRGNTPYVGDNRNWWIDGTDTGVLAWGVTPHIGENKNWFFGDIDSGVCADAKAANTPYIGANDNWWIGGADTGVRARPIDGIDGKTPTIEIGGNDNWIINGTDIGKPSARKPYALVGYYESGKSEHRFNTNIIQHVYSDITGVTLTLSLYAASGVDLRPYAHAIQITPCMGSRDYNGDNYLSCEYKVVDTSAELLSFKIYMYDCNNTVNEYSPTVSVFIPNLQD